MLLPNVFDRTRRYRLLVAVHGSGGHGRNFFLASAARREADARGLEVIVVAPSFTNDDSRSGASPSQGEGGFLRRVIDALRDDYKLRQRILLTGYSRGGFFTHRFAFQNPERVEAAAPLAAGAWTTRDGQFVSRELASLRTQRGTLANPRTQHGFPSSLSCGRESLARKLLGPVLDAQTIPFLVMVGTEDPRLEITQEFARRLTAAGYAVETEWPRTPHSCYTSDPSGDGLVWSMECETEYENEFLKYPVHVVDFFVRATQQE